MNCRSPRLHVSKIRFSCYVVIRDTKHLPSSFDLTFWSFFQLKMKTTRVQHSSTKETSQSNVDSITCNASNNKICVSLFDITFISTWTLKCHRPEKNSVSHLKQVLIFSKFIWDRHPGSSKSWDLTLYIQYFISILTPFNRRRHPFHFIYCWIKMRWHFYLTLIDNNWCPN